MMTVSAVIVTIASVLVVVAMSMTVMAMILLYLNSHLTFYVPIPASAMIT
ncbi:MAG: hypothetical protein ACOC41_00535 [Chitinivibrionales bacterium]